MKNILFAFLILFCYIDAKAQLSGTYSVPGSYSTVAAAILDLNTQGVNGPTTIQIAAGYTETAVAGGYSLTATGSSSSPIVFQKNGTGANPLILAYTGGTAVPSSPEQDGIWRLIGSDFITIDGIDLIDPNTTNPATMEFGFGLFKSSNTDGCNDNIIRNCVVTLNRINILNGLGTAMAGSRGIDLVNATSFAHTTSLTVIAYSGSSSNNRFYNNLIQNCNIGITLIGFPDVAPYTYVDNNNDVGGLSAATGNTIINYGGGTGTVNAAAGIKTLAQYSLNLSHNSINNNNGSGLNHTYDLFGMHIQAAEGADVAVMNNTISIKGGGSARQLYGISSAAGSTTLSNSVQISHNHFEDCSFTAVNTGSFYGIHNSGSPVNLVISNNTFSNNSSFSTNGVFTNIYNSSASPNVLISNNSIVSLSLTTGFSTGVTVRGIVNTGGVSGGSVAISSNSIQSVYIPNNSTHSFGFISHGAAYLTGKVLINDNSLTNIALSSNRIMTLYSMSGNTGNTTFTGNVVIGFSNAAASTQLNVLDIGGSSQSGTLSITANTFSNISVTGATQVFGIGYQGSSTQTLAITFNTLSGVSTGSNVSGFFLNNYNNSVLDHNLITNINAGGYIRALSLFNNAGQLHTISNNTIIALTSSNSIVTGILQSQGNVNNIFRNKLADLTTLSPTIRVEALAIQGGTVVNAYNNIIGDLKAPSSAIPDAVSGIYVSGGSTVNLLYNTVYIAATSTGSAFGTSAVYCTTTTAINLRNNILINLSVATGTGITAAFKRNGTSITSYSSSSNNNIFYAGTPSVNSVLFYAGTTTYSTLSAFKTAVNPRESLSYTENTVFQSLSASAGNFLHIGSLSLAESHAVNIVGLTDDVDGDIRQGNPGYTGSGLAPDIGADEFNTATCNTVAPVSMVSSSLNICAGQSVTLTRSEYSVVPGLSQIWQVSNVSGGSYTTIPSANGLTFISGTLSPGTYYFSVKNTCTVSNQFAISGEATVSVHAYPFVTVSPTVVSLCLGSSTILTASGAANFTWSPSSSLSSTNGASVTATPSQKTTYLVTGSNPGNCTGPNSTASVVVTVLSAGTLSVSATPTLVCQGGSVNLQAVASTTVYSVSPISFAPVTTPTSGAGVGLLCNNGNINTSMSGNLNDGGWTYIGLPFNFTLFGTVYNSYMVCTNGYIQLFASFPSFIYNGYGVPLPTFNAPTSMIGAHCANLDFSNSGMITVYSDGVTPNRRLMVTWKNGRYYNGSTGTGTVTTQMILYETSNWIDVHTTMATGQLPAIEGIQNSSADMAAVVPLRNAQTFTITNDAYRWHFPVSYSWTPSTHLSSTTLSNTTASNVQSNITYTVNTMVGNGCGLSGVTSISVLPSPTLSIVGVTVPLCAGTTVSLVASGADTYTWTNGPQTATYNPTPAVTTTFVVSGNGTLNACVGNASQVVTVVPNPTIGITGTYTLCEGRSATLTASGADSYTWSTGNLTPVLTTTISANTTYSVTGSKTLAACSSTAQITVTVYPNPTISVTGTSVVCSGQAATLSAFGANTYSWSGFGTGAVLINSPQTPRTYTVVGTSSLGGCSHSVTHMVHVNPSPTLNVSGGNNVCTGDSLTLIASGADSYSWSTTAVTPSIVVTPTTTGFYTVIGTNIIGACSSTVSHYVNLYPLPLISISGPVRVCLGNTATFIASGGQSYLWSNNMTSSSITETLNTNSNYSVTGLSPLGCSGTAAISVSVDPLPVISINAPSSICAHDSATLTAVGQGSYSYAWSTSQTGGTIVVKPTTTTTFSLEATDNTTSCKNSASVVLLVDPCTGLQKSGGTVEIKLYPNPFSSFFVVENPAAGCLYVIIDMTGKEIQRGEFMVGRNEIDLSEYAKGVYLLKLTTSTTMKNFRLVNN